jgi:hypothetical protein
MPGEPIIFNVLLAGGRPVFVAGVVLAVVVAVGYIVLRQYSTKKPESPLLCQMVSCYRMAVFSLLICKITLMLSLFHFLQVPLYSPLG